MKKTDITVKNSTLISKATTQGYELNSGAATGVGYGVVLAGYVAGTPYEGTILFENNTFNLSAGEGAIRILKYNGTEGVDFEKESSPTE